MKTLNALSVNTHRLTPANLYNIRRYKIRSGKLRNCWRSVLHCPTGSEFFRSKINKLKLLIFYCYRSIPPNSGNSMPALHKACVPHWARECAPIIKEPSKTAAARRIKRLGDLRRQRRSIGARIFQIEFYRNLPLFSGSLSSPSGIYEFAADARRISRKIREI